MKVEFTKQEMLNIFFMAQTHILRGTSNPSIESIWEKSYEALVKEI